MKIFDFPPRHDLIDAHAVWHGGTIPLGFLWYSFLVDDAAFETGVAASDRDRDHDKPE